MKCRISYVSLLVKGADAIRKLKLHKNATAKRRRLLRALSGIAKAKVKPKAKSRGPRKQCKSAELPAHGYESWAMLKPFDLFCSLVNAGETERLCLVVLKCSVPLKRFGCSCECGL